MVSHSSEPVMDRTALLGKLEEIQDKPNFKGWLCRVTNVLLDEEDEETVENICAKYIVDWKSDPSLAILGIRYHVMCKEFEEAKALLFTVAKPRKRHFSLIMNETKDFDLFYKMVQRGFEMDGDDVAIFWDTPHIYKVLMLLHDKYITIPKEIEGTTFDPPATPSPSEYVLEKLFFSDSVRHQIMDDIKAPPLKRDRGPKPTIVIDGANVLFYGHREVDDQSFVRLTNVYNMVKKEGYVPQIVLHKHHLRGKKIDKEVRNAIIFPKKGSHDDLYFIGLALAHYPCYVLSNDLLRDHIVKNVMIKTWITEYGIRYECLKGDAEIKLTKPQEWSNILQSGYNQYYVHREDGKWLVKTEA